MKKLAIGVGAVALAACGTTASMNMPMNTTTVPVHDANLKLPTTTVAPKVTTQHQLAMRWYKAQQVRIYLETIFYNNTVYLNNMVKLNDTIRSNALARAHAFTVRYQHRISMQRIHQLSSRAISNRAPKSLGASSVRQNRQNSQAGTGACGGSLPPCYVMHRESGGNLRAHNPTSTAAGKWQFLTGTWNHYGGYATADQAPESVQDGRAREVWANGRGCSAWSAC